MIGANGHPSAELAPNSVEAEINVLGSMLLDAGAAVQLAGLLKPRDFFRPGHAEAFEVLVGLADRQVAIDPATFHAELQRRGLLQSLGGMNFITTITAAVPTTANAEFYAQTVKDCSQRRALMAAAARIDRVAREPEDRSIAEVVAEAHATLDAVDAAEKRQAITMKDVLAEVFASIDGAKTTESAISSSFQSFDQSYGCFEPGSFVVLGARPSVGKTTLAFQIALNAARRDRKRVLFFSIEMPRERLAKNILAHMARVDSAMLLPRRAAFLSDEQWARLAEASNALSGLALAIDDTPDLDPAALRAKAMRHQQQHGLDFVVIDYLGLMDTSAVRSRNSTRENEVAWLSRKVKSLAKEMRLPILCLAQLNRQNTNRPDQRPRLSDLRDSGCVEQDADVVLLLHRPDMTTNDPKEKDQCRGETELIVAKNRCGPTGVQVLHFDAPMLCFSETF